MILWSNDLMWSNDFWWSEKSLYWSKRHQRWLSLNSISKIERMTLKLNSNIIHQKVGQTEEMKTTLWIVFSSHLPSFIYQFNLNPADLHDISLSVYPFISISVYYIITLQYIILYHIVSYYYIKVTDVTVIAQRPPATGDRFNFISFLNQTN